VLRSLFHLDRTVLGACHSRVKIILELTVSAPARLRQHQQDFGRPPAQDVPPGHGRAVHQDPARPVVLLAGDSQVQDHPDPWLVLTLSRSPHQPSTPQRLEHNPAQPLHLVQTEPEPSVRGSYPVVVLPPVRVGYPPLRVDHQRAARIPRRVQMLLCPLPQLPQPLTVTLVDLDAGVLGGPVHQSQHLGVDRPRGTNQVDKPHHATVTAGHRHHRAGHAVLGHLQVLRRDQLRRPACQPADPDRVRRRLLLNPVRAGVEPEAGSRTQRLRIACPIQRNDGSAGRVIGVVVSGTVTAAEPSRLDAGLLDVTVDSDPREPQAAGILDILGYRCAGQPPQRNLWAGYDRELRHQWSGVALGHMSGAPDRPPGTTYDLDGRFVTDIEGFYCAIGEAINGPGGYFGWNLDALNDCLRGRFGAQTPFRLVWQDSAIAREHLVAGYDQRHLGPATTLEDVLDMLTEHRIEIDLR
jgi:RNAse (barnase) inhibitor barstar